MSSLVVCTVSVYKSQGIDVVWLSGRDVFELQDATGRIGKRQGYPTATNAILAAGRLAAKRYREAIERESHT